MISSIKNLFSTVLSFFVGLFGGKKSQDQPGIKAATTKKKKGSGYFMELDEAEDALANTTQAAKDAATKTLESTKDAATKALESTKDAATKTLEKVTNAKPGQVLESTKDAATKTLEKVTNAKPGQVLESTKDATTKTLEKVTNAKPGQPEPVAAKAGAAKPGKNEAATQAPKVELVQSAEGVRPVPAKPSVVSDNGQEPTEKTFAPKYLAPTTSSNGRRRPGPNMSSFLDMARQVNTPG